MAIIIGSILLDSELTMPFSPEQLNKIYNRTSGYCHICHKKLSFKNYGSWGARGAWEVEHSNPQANGGSHRLSNLYSACIACNRSKGASSTRSARAKNGKTRAPLSTKKREFAKAQNTIAGGTVGALAGAVFGPAGAIVGAFIGAHLGAKENPDW